MRLVIMINNNNNNANNGSDVECMSRAAVGASESLSSVKKLDRQNSLVEPLDVKMNSSAVIVSTKSFSSLYRKLDRRNSLEAPLAINVSRISLKLVSRFCYLQVCVYLISIHTLYMVGD